MLQIDYSIIPLTDEDRRAIDEVISAKIESGEVPHIDKSHHGRVVVLNPDAVQTVHHVPDELRAPLRRSIHATMEASLPLGAERLFRGLVEEEGPLYF